MFDNFSELRDILVECLGAGSHSTIPMKIRSCSLVTCLITVLFGCQSGNAIPPDHLIGVWKTTAPQYDGRFLKFTEESVIFGTEGDSPEIYSITTIDKAGEGTHLMYTIAYVDSDGQEYHLSFYYHSANGGSITFKNQTHLTWTKEGETS